MIRTPAETRREPFRKWRPTTLALALLLAPAASAWAQSLMEVYETARSYDASYLAAVAQARSVEYQARQSDALRLPTVGLQGNVTRQRFDNYAEYEALFGDRADFEAMAERDEPRAMSARQLPPGIKARIAARAAVLVPVDDVA